LTRTIGPTCRPRRFQEIGSGPARQRHEGVRQLLHLLDALVHVVDETHLGNAAVAPLHLLHEMRQDADHVSPLFERAVGQRAHQPG
jgi:hypothetical protein